MTEEDDSPETLGEKNGNDSPDEQADIVTDDSTSVDTEASDQTATDDPTSEDATSDDTTVVDSVDEGEPPENASEDTVGDEVEPFNDDQPDGETDEDNMAELATRARGLPAVWSTLLGLPFVTWGGYVTLGGTGAPPETGIPILLFGLFVSGLGLYIHFVAAPEPPMMRETEEIVDTRKPSQRAAAAKILIGLVLLLGGGYLLFFTFSPYLYPIIAGAVGLFFFSTGLYAYWTNTLTTYYVTNQRLIKEYRFISLVRQELTFEKVRGVEERRTLWETLVGLGNVRVASGGGTTLEVVIRNIPSSTAFANEIRTLV